MAELRCPKCGSTSVKKDEMLMDSKVGPKVGPLAAKGLTSHVFEAHICEQCGYVVEFYYRGTALRTG
jgi:predicted nucleic-acid-binding Zn-ribbon protein